MYIDTNVFVYANNDVSEKGESARKLLKEIAKGKAASTSALAVDEMMWVLRKNKVPDRIRSAVENMYRISNLDIAEVHSLAPLRALDFMEQHNLKPRDAMHLAIMEQLREKEIASDDKDFDRVPGIRRIAL